MTKNQQHSLDCIREKKTFLYSVSYEVQTFLHTSENPRTPVRTMTNHPDGEHYSPRESLVTSKIAIDAQQPTATTTSTTTLLRHIMRQTTTTYADDMAESGHSSKRKSPPPHISGRQRRAAKDDVDAMSRPSRLFVVYQFLARLSGE